MKYLVVYEEYDEDPRPEWIDNTLEGAKQWIAELHETTIEALEWETDNTSYRERIGWPQQRIYFNNGSCDYSIYQIPSRD